MSVARARAAAGEPEQPGLRDGPRDSPRNLLWGMHQPAPLMAPALALLAGVWLGLDRATASLLPAVASAVPGVVGVRGRVVFLALGIGWCLGVTAPGIDVGHRIDPQRPVDAIGRPVGAWSRSAHGWHAPFEVRSLRQGAAVDTATLRVELWIASEERPDGSPLRARGYLRPPRESLNGPLRAPGRWTLSVGSPHLVTALEAPRRGRAHLLATLRKVAEDRLASAPGAAGSASTGAGSAGAMAGALLLGDSEALPIAWLLALRRLGLGHLIAVSGLHVGLAAGIVWLGLAPLPPQRRWAPVAVSVGLYLALVGARPSLLRASVMTLIALASLATERRPMARNAWAAAVGGMVLWQPRLLLDLGFQLTAAATLGLICLAPALTRRWRDFLPAWLALALAAGVAAHLFTLPWSVGVFFLWSPVSILLNLVAVPWTAAALAASFAVLVAGRLPGVGSAAWWLLEWSVAPFGWLAELPVAAWASWPTMLAPWLAAALAAVVGWGLVRARPALAGAICLLAAGLLVRGAPSAPTPPETAEAVLLDVGQGEAIVLRDGARVVLVDGGGWLGPGIGQRVLLPALVRLGVRRLDAVVLTHPDRDHCAGLVEIVHLLEVDELWASLGWRSACHRRLVGRAGLRLRPLWRDMERRVGAWNLTVLHPPAGDRSSGNERSLVLRAEATGGTILLTGDVGAATERLLVAKRGTGVAADVLKLGHHGSRHSTSEPFLDRVRPRLAVVSAGAGNIYGHPAEEVLDRLAARGIALYRTDDGGQIRLRPMATGAWRVEQPWRRTLP